jgi:hypothetical protein
MGRLASAPEKRRCGRLVIRVIRIDADDKSRPASPITLNRRAGAFPRSSKQES